MADEIPANHESFPQVDGQSGVRVDILKIL
jgi:hypothetical protein